MVFGGLISIYSLYNIVAFATSPASTGNLLLGIAAPAVGTGILNYRAMHAMFSGLSTVRRALKYTGR